MTMTDFLTWTVGGLVGFVVLGFAIVAVVDGLGDFIRRNGL